MVENLEKQSTGKQALPSSSKALEDDHQHGVSHYDTVGSHLKSLRETGGHSLEETSARTKIKSIYLEAIENADYASLPATPYAVGFVKIYATFLDQDADIFAAKFRGELMSPDSALNQPSVTAHPSLDIAKTPAINAPATILATTSAKPADHTPSSLAILSIIILIISAVWAFMSLMRSDEQSAPISSPQVAIETPTSISSAPKADPVISTPQQEPSNQVPQILQPPQLPQIPLSEETPTTQNAVIDSQPLTEVASEPIALPTVEEEISQSSEPLPQNIIHDSPIDEEISTQVETENTQEYSQESIGARVPENIEQESINIIRGPNNRLNTPGADRVIYSPVTSIGDISEPEDTNSVNTNSSIIDSAELETSITRDLDSDIIDTQTIEIQNSIEGSAIPSGDEHILPNSSDNTQTAALIEDTKRDIPPDITSVQEQPIIQEATIARQATLEYPNFCARRANETDSVKVRFDLTDRGEVINQRVVESSRTCFEKTALNNIKKWRYNPKLENGRPVGAKNLSVTMKFLIQ